MVIPGVVAYREDAQLVLNGVLAATGRGSRESSRWEAKCCLDKMDKITVVLVRSPSAPCRSSRNSIRVGCGGVHLWSWH